MRAHIVLDEKLIDLVDRVAGKRKRSQFIESAVRQAIQRRLLEEALEESAGSLEPEEYPHWATPQAVSDWVHNMRRADQAMIDERRQKREEERNR